MERNIDKLIEKTKGTIDVRYDMTNFDLKKLSERKDSLSKIIDSFVFGYAQGMKAALAERKGR